MLKRSFIFSAALLTPGTITRLLGQPSAAVTAGEGMHVLAVADFGTADQNQIAVAQAMEKYAGQLPNKPTAVLALGDNFYGSMAPERFQTGFENMYRAQHHLDCPFYACLGNHDYEETKAPMELAYGQENPTSRWKMPAKWYVTELGPTDQPLLRVIMLDSNYWGPLTPPEEAEQDRFLAMQLAAPTKAAWTIVAGHHPLFSNGPHKDNARLIEHWGPLLKESKVPIFVCGHDHLMQHLQIDGYDTSFVITGGGGYPLYQSDHRYEPFAESFFGFTHFQITAQAITTRLLGTEGKCLHAFARYQDGTMTVLPPV